MYESAANNSKQPSDSADTPTDKPKNDDDAIDAEFEVK
jgi:hypothetical protein